MSTFRPPVAYTLARVLPETRGPALSLFRRYSRLPVGQSVLKIDGTYQTIPNPTQAQCEAATEVYLGGREYEVSSAVATALTAAGYGAYLS